MRTRCTVVTVAVLATCSAFAAAQGQDTPAGGGSAVTPPGLVDIGARATWTSGDEARYERYRDLRTGATFDFSFAKDTGSAWVSAAGRNLGYRDGRYAFEYANGRIRASVIFESIPLQYSVQALTPYATTVSGGTAVLTLDQDTRARVQAGGVVGVPQTVSDLARGSAWAAIAQRFDLRSRRDTLTAEVRLSLTDALTADVGLRTFARSGNKPSGASFAFNVATEVPVPIDDRTTDLATGIEWAGRRGMLGLTWDGSWFDNHVQALEWDNPYRSTDYTSGRPPYYDVNGYTNGNGAARGRLALPPGNAVSEVSATGLVKLPARSTVNGTFAVTSLTQDAALIPWTSNGVVATAATYASFPGLQAPGRATAEADVRRVLGAVNFTTRPTRLFSLTARYRFDDRRDRTPEFSGEQYVRFDAVPEACPGCVTEHLDTTQNRLDVDASFAAVRHATFRVGYGCNRYSHSLRAYETLTDNTARASVDSVGNRYVSVRAMFEHTRRSGTGFDPTAITDGGAQPGLRYYDDAERSRDRGTVVVLLSPVPVLDVSVSYAGGRDTYDGPGQSFGFLDNSNHVVGVNATLTPRPGVVLGVDYGHETYNADQRSRNANPLSGVAGAYESWVDPNRDWALGSRERVNVVGVFVDLPRVLPGTDIKLGFDYTDSDNGYAYSGSRIRELGTNTALTAGDSTPCAAGVSSCFEALPAVTSTWRRLTVDVRHALGARLGIGASYVFEKLAVTNFATVDSNGPVGFYPATGTPRIDYLGEISTGYATRPYTGHTAIVHVYYRF